MENRFTMGEVEDFQNSQAISLTGVGPGAVSRLIKPGEIVGGMYRLESLLGKGGSGYVFRATHTVFGRQYALKMLAPELLKDEARIRFETEARVIASMDHPSVVKVYDMGLDAGNSPYYVMDLLGGRTLAECIAAGEHFDFETSIDIFRQVAEGLAYAHSKGIVHRDVKPSNIMILPGTGRRLTVKLVDFGIMKLLPTAQFSRQSKTATGVVFGSPYYMSPEQCMGANVDQRSDIYSLGCTIFETLSGRPPFPGTTAMQTVMMHQDAPIPKLLETSAGSGLPGAIDLLVTKAMAKRPESRYQTMDQLLHDLARIKQGKVIGATSMPPSMSGSHSRSGYNPRGASPAMPETLRDLAAESDKSEEKQALSLLLKLAVFVLALGLIVASVLVFPEVRGCWIAHVGPHKAKIDPSKDPRVPDLIKKEARRKHLAETVAPEIFGLPVKQTAPGGKTTHEDEATNIYRTAPCVKSKLVTVNGQTMRKFTFPEWSIGRVSDMLRTVQTEAVKDVYVPPNQPLCLAVGGGDSMQVLRAPKVLEKIDPDEFCGFSLSAKNLSGFRGMMEGAPNEVTDPLETIFPILAKWKKLEMVALVGMPISRHEFDLFNKLEHLRHVELNTCVIDSEDFARQPLLLRLTALKLERSGRLEGLLDKLGQSSNLRDLSLVDCNTTPGALTKLAKIKHLQSFDLQDHNVEKLVPSLVRLPPLKLLRLSDASLTPAQIHILTACPNIGHLVLVRAALTPETVLYCSRREPKVSFED